MKEFAQISEAERRYDALPPDVREYLNLVYMNRNPKLTPEDKRQNQVVADNKMLQIQENPQHLESYLNWQVFAIENGIYPKT